MGQPPEGVRERWTGQVGREGIRNGGKGRGRKEGCGKVARGSEKRWNEGIWKSEEWWKERTLK